MWDEITYSFLNFNGATVEVSGWITNFTPPFFSCDYLSMLRLKLNHVSKRVNCKDSYITNNICRAFMKDSFWQIVPGRGRQVNGFLWCLIPINLITIRQCIALKVFPPFTLKYKNKWFQLYLGKWTEHYWLSMAVHSYSDIGCSETEGDNIGN